MNLKLERKLREAIKGILSEMDMTHSDLQLPSDEEILKTVQRNLDKRDSSLGEDEDPIARAKTMGLDSVDWNAEGAEYAGSKEEWDALGPIEKDEIISFLKDGWHSSHNS